MQHPKALLWSVLVLAVVVSIVYYLSMTMWGTPQIPNAPVVNTTDPTTKAPNDSLLNSLKSTTTQGTTLTTQQNNKLNSLKSPSASNSPGKTVNNSLLDSLKAK